MDANDRRYVQIGLKIAYYRKLNGLTQEQLAEKVGISSGYLSQVGDALVGSAHFTEDVVCHCGFISRSSKVLFGF